MAVLDTYSEANDPAVRLEPRIAVVPPVRRAASALAALQRR